MRVVLYDPGNFTPHYVENLGTSLAGLGVTVEVVTSPPLFEKAAAGRPYPVEEVFFRSSAGEFLRRRATLRQAIKAVSYPAGLWRTWQLLKRRPAGILHVQWALFPVLDFLLIRRLRARGWRIVYTAHDLITDLNRRWRRGPLRMMLREIDAVVVHTDGLARLMRANGGNIVCEIPEGISTFPLSEEMGRTEARRMLGLDCDGPLLLFFGMIKPYKGLDDLLEAWPAVLREFPGARLLIAGEALMPFDSFRTQIDRLGIRDSVIVRLGYVPSSETQRYFRAADAVILPYKEISTSGVVPLACRYSIPVIATAAGGMPEIIEDGATGLLVAPGSRAALAAGICRGLRDREGLAAMGVRAGARFEEKHCWRRSAQKTLELYESLE